MISGNLLKAIWLLLAIELGSCRTITTHRETVTNPNGVFTKTWRTFDENVEPTGTHETNFMQSIPDDVDVDMDLGTQAFNNNDQSFPQEQGKPIWNGMNPLAVSELLKTKQPVVTTTTDENGRTRTTTLTLEPDGTISSRTIIKSKPVLRTQWLPVTRTTLAEPSSTATSPWKHFDTNFESHNSWPMTIPDSWEPPKWSFDRPIFEDRNTEEVAKPHTPPKTIENDPIVSFNISPPPILPTPRASATHNYAPKKAIDVTPSPKPSSSLDEFLKTTTPFLNLEDFLKQQYETTTKSAFSPNTPKISYTPKNVVPLSESPTSKQPVTTLQLEDLPIEAVLNNGTPVEESFLKTLPPDLRNQIKPQIAPHTITNIQNIPPNVSTQTNVKSISKSIPLNSVPTAKDLDPSMLNILRAAGINPDEIKSENGDQITRTRIEPDGRRITTTYRVKKLPSQGTMSHVVPDRMEPHRSFDFEMPDVHSSGSRTSIKFPTFMFPPTTERTITGQPSLIPPPTTAKVPEPTFYSPLANTDSRSVDPNSSSSLPTNKSSEPPRPKSPIDEFLAINKLHATDIMEKHGTLTKTIVDDNGRILTVHFILSLPVRMSTENQPKPVPIK